MRKTLLAGASAAALVFGLALAPVASAQTADPMTQPETESQAPLEAQPGTEIAPDAGTAAQPAPAQPETVEPQAAQPEMTEPAEEPSTGTLTENAEQPVTTPTTATSAVDPSGVQPPGTVLSDNVVGGDVEDGAGESLATVQDLVLSPEGQITHVVVSYGGFLGMGAKQVLVPWESVQVDQDGTIRVALTQEELDAAPEFKTQSEQQAEMESQIQEEQRIQEAQQPATE